MKILISTVWKPIFVEHFDSFRCRPAIEAYVWITARVDQIVAVYMSYPFHIFQIWNLYTLQDKMFEFMIHIK